jgi:hypothetical protein
MTSKSGLDAVPVFLLFNNAFKNNSVQLEKNKFNFKFLENILDTNYCTQLVERNVMPGGRFNTIISSE